MANDNASGAGGSETKTPASIPWEDPPTFCPRCGGQRIIVRMVEWHAASLNPGDTGNTCTLDEHQCLDCEGASFWT